MLKGFRLTIYGHVQGVCYRAYLWEHAVRLGIGGWVRNNPDGSVSLEAFGEEDVLKKYYEIALKGPRSARVRDYNYEEIVGSGDLRGFEIRYG